MVTNIRRSNSVLMALVALLVGAGFGYFGPRCVAGRPDSAWLPLAFAGMEISTGTTRTVIPRAPRFVSEGNHRLSGQAKFFRLPSADGRSVRLGYTVNITPPPYDSRAGMTRPCNLTRDVRFSFSLLDADGFPLHYARSDSYLLHPGEPYSFQGVLEQPVPPDLADLVTRIDCRLCFEGIEIP